MLEGMTPKYPVITFRAEMPVNIEYVTCPDPYDEMNYVIAERIVFITIGGFLNSDFYKAFRGVSRKFTQSFAKPRS